VNEPRWLEVLMVRAIHANQVQEHGGSLGLRDKGLLESAMARPRHRFQYEAEIDVIDLAASYGFGLTRNHPFVDGNKRVAFQAMYVFLGLNGLRIDADEPDVVHTMLALAAGELDEPELAAWLRRHVSTR
jgi:death on curing protein